MRYRLNIAGNVRSEIIFGSVKEALCEEELKRWDSNLGGKRQRMKNPVSGSKWGFSAL